MTGLGEQRLGLGVVLLLLGQLRVFRMDRRHVMILARRALAAVGDLQQRVVVGAGLDRLAHPRIVEGFLVHLHAGDAGLGGHRGVDDDPWNPLQDVQLGHVELVGAVNLLGGQRGQPGRAVLAQVDVVDLVQVGRLAPVVVPAAQDRLAADLEIGQLEGPGADRVLGQIAALLVEAAVHDRGRVVVEVLRDLQGGPVQVQTHRVVVDFLHRALGHPLGHDRIAAVVLLAGVDLLGQGGEEADVGRAGVGVEPAGDVVDHIVGVELVAVRPLDALAQIEGPGLEVVRGLPTLRQIGPGDVVRSGLNHVLDDLAGDVGLLGPVEGRRIGHLLDLHAEAQPAAAFGLLGQGLGHQVLSGELAGHGIGRGRRDAKQGGRAQEIAPADLLLAELLTELGNVGVDTLAVLVFQDLLHQGPPCVPLTVKRPEDELNPWRDPRPRPPSFFGENAVILSLSTKLSP
jgi:hypothetical protein